VDYAYLSSEQRAELLRQRLLQMETEHYQREIDRRIGLDLPNGNGQEMVADAEAAQALIESAYAIASAQLGELGKST
jgi:hypothetical protein